MRKFERVGWALLGGMLMLPFLWFGHGASSSTEFARAGSARAAAGADSSALEATQRVQRDARSSDARSGGAGSLGIPLTLEGIVESFFASTDRAPGSTRGPASVGSASAAPVDFGYSNRDPNFARLPRSAFDPRDLAVLEDIIALNRLDENASDFDFDNGDGSLEPTELGDQRWCNGRLRELRLGPDSYSSFGYEIAELPSSIGNLQGLLVLEANEVGLQRVPPAVADLAGLQRVSFYNNDIAEIPRELGTALQLQEIQLGGNPVAEIPPEIAQSPTLQRLFVDESRLEEIPPMLERQREATMSGSLVVPPRQLGPLGRNCLPLQG